MTNVFIIMTLLGALLNMSTVMGGECVVCPNYCTDCYYNPGNSLVITGAVKGYSIDNYNGLCYPTCASNQYYDPAQRLCINCGNGCATCTYNNQLFVVTSAVTGYLVDSLVQTCYSCTSSQYYDWRRHMCVNCPYGCTSCSWNEAGLNVTITTAQTGYTINHDANICVVNCANGQYYNAQQGICLTCPRNCSTCVGAANGSPIVTTANTGFSVDSVNNICYPTCSSSQYYSYQSQSCQNCPTGCASCYLTTYGNSYGGLYISSAQKGYSIDSYNSICYPTCSSGQYYNPGTLSCNNCPNYCTSCSYVNGTLVIQSAQTGYSIDNVNGGCYQSCNSTAYYKPF